MRRRPNLGNNLRESLRLKFEFLQLQSYRYLLARQMQVITLLRIACACWLVIILAPTQTKAMLTPGEQTALHQLFVAFPSLAFAPYDSSLAWSDTFYHLCTPSNATTVYFGLRCSADGHIGAIELCEHALTLAPTFRPLFQYFDPEN